MNPEQCVPAVDLREVICSEVGRAGVGALVDIYFDPAWGFAGLLFDGAGAVLTDNPPDEFTVDDLLATTLLDVSVSAKATTALLGGRRHNEGLGKISAQAKLWDCDEESVRHADELWHLLCELEGIGPVIAGKLLARKRPHLIPVVDSVILKALPLAKEAWRNLRFALAEVETRDAIEAVRGDVPSTISTLRILDVSIWMLHSGGSRAIAARAAAGINRGVAQL
jgi:hypothetical protein